MCTSFANCMSLKTRHSMRVIHMLKRSILRSMIYPVAVQCLHCFCCQFFVLFQFDELSEEIFWKNSEMSLTTVQSNRWKKAFPKRD